MAKEPAKYDADALYDVSLQHAVRYKGRMYRPGTAITTFGRVLSAPEFVGAVVSAVKRPPNATIPSSGQTKAGGQPVS